MFPLFKNENQAQRKQFYWQGRQFRAWCAGSKTHKGSTRHGWRFQHHITSKENKGENNKERTTNSQSITSSITVHIWRPCTLSLKDLDSSFQLSGGYRPSEHSKNVPKFVSFTANFEQYNCFKGSCTGPSEELLRTSLYGARCEFHDTYRFLETN